MENYKGGQEASEMLGGHQRTLYQWEKKGKIETIRTPGKKRLYNVEKFLKGRTGDTEEKENIVYVRVSSAHQKDDLVSISLNGT